MRALRAEPVPAIIIAARDGDVDALRRELDLGVSVDLADAWKSTPLQVACGAKEVSEEGYTTNRAHPYLRKIETAGGWKAYEKAHRTKLLATFVPKFTHLIPKELVPLIVEFSFHVGFY